MADRLEQGRAAAIDQQPLILAGTGSGLEWVPGELLGYNMSLDASLLPAHTFGCSFAIPLPHLRTAQRVTAFTSYGSAACGDAAATVSLYYIDDTANPIQVGASHNLPASPGAVTTSGLTHDVLANKGYCIEVVPTGSAGTLQLFYVQLTVTRP